MTKRNEQPNTTTSEANITTTSITRIKKGIPAALLYSLLKQTNGSTILSSNTPIQRRRAAAPSSGGSNGGSKMDSQFDSLKREATKLERNLEDKVARYQQVSLSFERNGILFF